MTHLIENDTDKKKNQDSAPSDASPGCPLPMARVQMTGRPWVPALTGVDVKRLCVRW